MKVLLAEYTTAHDPVLAHEGRAMLGVLRGSFERCGYEVVLPGDGDFGSEIERLAPSCDMGLVIAPDHLLSKYTMILEQHTHNLGCGFMTVALCANKVKTRNVLRQHNIPVPGEPGAGKRVIKPVKGCGSLGVRFADGNPGKDEFAEEYVDGEHLSVSIVANRVIGDACQYFTGKPPVVLAVNRQDIRIDPDGHFRYCGGETPVHPAREDKIIAIALKTAEVLGCQGYCGVDIVAGDRICVIEVNPRITTSLVGIAACMKEEIADILVSASKGQGPDRVHLSGRVRFNKDGAVTRV
ncbi:MULTISPECIES: ATP-grasp domain-containing protein [unclassified Methanoregula]|uniref:ATP-grasp domain-containing protein n=1 Tax=unclassified Methanoregula TaxID=2649730 RepID=UPI0009C9A9F8|nr:MULTISPECIES: ATP-grasp domain-containing protein [unclassified Methanoregula]OPX63912.1 MAG: D-alanine--D-alanine ligase [Methanoregula sp. PtaB.Bin085]OPY35464.1 MAG: D-alanine--D-alanine ligase [Methanoregula sp. PtaU1.Bin006]